MEKGSIVFTCALCEETKTVNIAEPGHKWLEATCTKPKTCDVCGATEGIALDHDYKTEEVQPTCTEKGGKKHTCTRCGEENMTDAVDALGHQYGPWTQVKEPTREETGLSTRVCEVCEHTEEQEIEKLKTPIGTIILLVVVVLLAVGAVVFVILKKKKAPAENT
jgi:transcription elongation factor Elf1